MLSVFSIITIILLMGISIFSCVDLNYPLLNTVSELPINLKIAVLCTELNNIKVVPSYYIKPKHNLFVLNIGDYNKRIIDKCSKILNNDIKKSLSKDENVKLYNYITCLTQRHLFITSVKMMYEIK